jgi:L-asparaginase
VDKDRLVMARRREERAAWRIVSPKLEPRVEVITLSAGSDGRLIGMALDGGMQGLVIEGLGRGNVPITALAELERALASSIPVVLTSRCWRGRVLDTYAYPGAGKPLHRAGVILGGSLPAHKARLKLMLLLGAGLDREAIRAEFEA